MVVTGGHPGDPEYGCGGTIAHYADLGHEVVLLYLNDGEPRGKPLGQAAGLRVAEAKAACAILGARPLFAGQVDGEAVVDRDRCAAAGCSRGIIQRRRFIDPVPVTDASITDVAPNPDAIIAPLDETAAVPREIIVKLPSMLRPRQVSPPPAPPKELGEYHLPSWECLAEAESGYVESQEAFVREKAAVLEQALKEFNVDAHVVEIDTGPVITMYELSLAPGLKVSAITSLTNDIMRSLKAESVRIVAPVPGKNTVGIEVPERAKGKSPLQGTVAIGPGRDGEGLRHAVVSGQGRQRRTADYGPGSHAPLPDRRHDRLGQIGLHQHDHHVDHVTCNAPTG